MLISCKNPPQKVSDEHNELVKLTNSTLKETSNKKSKKNVEIVFCLDATGSMSGLIGTAKEKIWDIVTELAQNNDIDSLKMGMIFYRDREDSFITKQIPMTVDLDEVYSDLLEINADGGGDTPESVNQALNESVVDMKWSDNKNTYKTIFVVGDCPPHMDYQDDIKYTESCKEAAKRGIIINTIKLGSSCGEAIDHFKKMAECTNGKFLMLDQNASDYTIATPYDNEINEVSEEIDDSRIYYGSEEERTYNYNKKVKSMEVYKKASATANSSRAEFKYNSGVGKKSSYGKKEIINDYEGGKLKLDSIEEDQLPKELKGKTIDEKTSIVKAASDKRKENYSKLKKLISKKKEYIESKKEQKDSLSFSKEVLKVMIEQSKK